MTAFHKLVDSAVPSFQLDFEQAVKRQKLEYVRQGKLVVTTFNPQVKLSRTAKKAIRAVIAAKADIEADAWVKVHAAKLVRGIDEETRRAVSALTRLLAGGHVSRSTAIELIGEIVGLTDRNAATIAHMYASGQSLADIQSKTKLMLVNRGKTIANTELALAANQGYQIAFEKALETGLIKPESRKVWRTYSTGACAICQPMNRKQAPVDEAFKNGLMSPPAHPNCRCTMTLNIAS